MTEAWCPHIEQSSDSICASVPLILGPGCVIRLCPACAARELTARTAYIAQVVATPPNSSSLAVRRRDWYAILLDLASTEGGLRHP